MLEMKMVLFMMVSFYFHLGVKSGDYHDDMNWNNFEKWAKILLIPNLPPHSVLVLDNASSYHNTIAITEPTTATRKADMISWLEVRNIGHDANLTKPELYSIIKQHKSAPYPEQLNPIEKI
jgi:hypothetical protein